MFLSKQCFRISFSQEELQEVIENLLKEKFWHEFRIASTSLLFEPYYFFSYDAFFEQKQEETGALVVKDTESGTMALNAASGEFDENISELIEQEEPEILKNSPVPQGIESEIERIAVSEAEVKRIAPMRLAAKLETSKQNIEISNVKLAFVPFWIAKVEIKGQNYEIAVNAVNGSIASQDEIPCREKSLLELTGETIFELKKPSAWVDYSKRVADSISNSKILHSIGKAVLTNHYVQIAIIIIIIVVLFWPRP